MESKEVARASWKGSGDKFIEENGSVREELNLQNF